MSGYRRCGFCYADISGDGEAQAVVFSDGLYPAQYVCADEDNCWLRQDWMDHMNGVPLRRHTRFLVITATTEEGEAVL